MRERVRTFISANFYLPGGALTDDASLLDVGIVDSTGILEVIGFLEETFGIEIADTEMRPENLDSVNNIVAFVERKQRAHAAATPNRSQ